MNIITRRTCLIQEYMRYMRTGDKRVQNFWIYIVGQQYQVPVKVVIIYQVINKSGVMVQSCKHATDDK